MKDRIIDLLKNQWFRVWAIFITLSLIPLTVTAEYKDQSNVMKRVVAASESQKMRFSSNKLVQSSNSNPAYVVEYKDTSDLVMPSDENQPSYYVVHVFLWNYSLQNPTRYMDSDIEYDVSFYFADRQGARINDSNVIGASRSVNVIDKSVNNNTNNFTLNSTHLNDTTVTFTNRHTLTKNVSSSNEFELRFIGWDLVADTDICVAMTATPTVGSSAELKTLSGAIGLAQQSEAGTSGWRAYLNEHPELTSVSNVSSYDGFNLVLTGSGIANITISWDSSKLDLNKNVYNTLNHAAFEQDGQSYPAVTGNVFGYKGYTPSDTLNASDENIELTVGAGNGSWKTIVIHADNKKFRSRYNIQLYKQPNTAYRDWSFFAYNVSDTTSTAYTNAYIRVNIAQTS